MLELLLIQDIVLINLRAEPVFFVRRDGDMIPYVPTTADLRVHRVDTTTPRSSTPDDVDQLTVADVEVAMRKEASETFFSHD